MTEMILDTTTLPEELSRFIRTNTVKAIVDGEKITIMPMEDAEAEYES